ncbi:MULTISPECIES: GNAT family N-acetyltransferase [unclassified Streptomyces]|uniref:GNAT family N-acetyltransferase n=1 Tax=unclassified Streptomyces TaxID=2593676 RepID=UPI00224F0847|nr:MULTISPECIES: GNAT family N-acetyltransferase [unclassified Streptomyces]MCX4795227.1 GNAT family N-acetyltransferase [Streptomyces sp. NBC_01242]WSJ36540.1 GNAT family N-acetyltransferase [Streptomyces sp. NBC_01321]WSP62958.1 GNAT family N-acetyltransferase [Streptomyces sp. NBC_01240]
MTRAMVPVRIEDGRAADAEAVARLVREVYQPFTADFRPTALKWTAEALHDCADSWLLARSDTGLLGAVRHGPDPEGYTLDTLSVAPSWRRQGVGSRLAAAVQERAAASGARQLIIAVRDSLAVNVAFFTSLGYRRERPFPPHHHVFTKEIGSPQ